MGSFAFVWWLSSLRRWADLRSWACFKIKTRKSSDQFESQVILAAQNHEIPLRYLFLKSPEGVPSHIVDEQFIQQTNLGGSNIVIHGIFVDIYIYLLYQLSWGQMEWVASKSKRSLLGLGPGERVVVPIVKGESPPKGPNMKLLMAGILHRIDWVRHWPILQPGFQHPRWWARF